MSSYVYKGTWIFDKDLDFRNVTDFSLECSFFSNDEHFKGFKIYIPDYSMIYIRDDNSDFLVEKEGVFIDSNYRNIDFGDNYVFIHDDYSLFFSQNLRSVKGNRKPAYKLTVTSNLEYVKNDAPNFIIEGEPVRFKFLNYDYVQQLTAYLSLNNVIQYTFVDFEGRVTINSVSGDATVTLNGQYNSTLANITLYASTSEKNRLDKTDYITEVAKYVGFFRDSISVVSPTFDIFMTDINIDFNYVYIDSFKRYYYVDDITIINSNIIRISCSVEVLYTYKNGIRSSVGFIDRNQYTFNDKIIDTKRVATQGTDIIAFTATGSDFDSYVGTVEKNTYNVVVNAYGSMTFPEE